jgi:GT2 family glycosyltransferase
MQLSVIIVSYQAAAELELCLWAVCKAIQRLAAEIIVVDNASSDRHIQTLSTYFPQVHWIWNRENKGFGAACNDAARLATGEYLLMLNPDTLIEAEGLFQALQFLDTNPTVAALGPYLLNGKGQFLKESRRAFPTPWNSFCKIIGLDHLLPHSRWLAGYYAGHIPISHPQPAEVLCGACMVLRKKAWLAIHGFDEDYFLYGEDTDLCLRLYQQGYPCYFFPNWKVLHFKYRSMKMQPQKHRYYFFNAMKIYVQKHFSHAQWYLRPGIDLLYWLSRFSSKFQQRVKEQPLSGKYMYIGHCTNSELAEKYPDIDWQNCCLSTLDAWPSLAVEKNRTAAVLNIQDFAVASCFQWLKQAATDGIAIALLTPYTQKLIWI